MMTNIWISAVGLCGTTIIGAVLGFFIKELPHKWNDTILGYCAGIMLAASTIGLIVPAFDQTSEWWWVAIGVMAIALHKLPEGMAAGVSMCSANGTTDWSVSLGIALQNIPEGMVIIAPLLVAGVSTMRTFSISLAIGLLEIAGVFIGFALGSASETFLPVMLGFAGGAMLYVTSDEMIPETHAHGYQKQATYALLIGFMTLVLLEKII